MIRANSIFLGFTALALAVISAGVLIFVGVTRVVRCSGAPYDPPPKSLQSPPVYPDAQNQIEYIPTPGAEDAPVRHISFDTTDKPEAISAFYKSILAKEGWLLWKYMSTSSLLTFNIENGCPHYFLKVALRPSGVGLIVIELTTYEEPCTCL